MLEQVLPPLSHPPIAEVVCGVVFDPIPALDPLTLGWYAANRRETFPTHQIQPALADAGEIYIGPSMPIRAWLLSKDGSFVLQVQHDRIFFNWRRGAASYPRFRDTLSSPGILTRSLDEFERFAAFCAQELGQQVAIRRAELTKVDHLVEGEHWTDLDDLGVLVPALSSLRSLASGSTASRPSFHVSFSGSAAACEVVTALTWQTTDVGRRRVVLETRVSGHVGGDWPTVRAYIEALNREANMTFGRTIPQEQRQRRFNGEEK